MITIDAASDLILTLPGVQSARQGSAVDFQVGKTIFASVTAERQFLLKLLPEQQEMIVQAEPIGFEPVAGGWGKRGWTQMAVEKLDYAGALSAFMIAWANVTPRKNKTPPTPGQNYRL